ncbi:MAG: ribonuclease P protein component [Tannerella sp.]|jgi:ribonuclease P protein component|nr:ribonuclease P protein component [Tannerella sp.]
MAPGRNTLNKAERLSQKRSVDVLYAKGQSFVAYPLRVVYLFTDEPQAVRAAFLVVVPKKRLHRAVKRNRVKRQVREAYRLRKSALLSGLEEKGRSLWIAFHYLEKELRPSADMNKAMDKAMKILSER